MVLRAAIKRLGFWLAVTGLTLCLLVWVVSTHRTKQQVEYARDPEWWLNPAISDEQLQAAFEPFVEVPETERLTVEETISLALCDEGCWGLERWANPDARPELWDIVEIDDDGIYLFQVVAFRILGYIGDASDVERIVRFVRSYSGVLNHADNSRVDACLYTIGTMALRGVDAAKKNLDDMSDVSYWKDSFEYRPDSLVRDNELTSELYWTASVLRAQAIAGEENLPEICRKVMSQIPDKKRRREMAWRINPLELRLSAASNRHYFGKRVPTESERHGLRLGYERKDEIRSARSRAVRELSKDFPEWMRPKPLR